MNAGDNVEESIFDQWNKSGSAEGDILSKSKKA